MAGPFSAVPVPVPVLPVVAVSTLELSLRMALSLACIGLLALVVLKVGRARLALGGSRPGIAVAARHQLTRSASVVVVRVGERHVLLGVSDHQVTLLAEGDDLVAPADPPSPPGRAAATGRTTAVDAGEAGIVWRPSRRAASRPGLGSRPREAAAQLPAGGADGPGKGGARMRHGRASRPASSRMGVIEALRERTVRRA